MGQYFPEPYGLSGGNVKVELNLSNYAAKVELKGATDIDTSTPAPKKGFVSFETNVGN